MKLVTVITGSPAEIAKALSNESLRPLWEPKLREVKKEVNGMLSLQYVGTTTQYQRSFDFEQLKSVGRQRRFLIHERVLINMGQNKAVRLYLLEEIKNKPFFLRVTLMAKVNSEDEGRSLLKSFTSLRTMLSQMDRAEETVGNMSMLGQVRSNNERTMSATGWNGQKQLDELNDL